MNRERVKVYTYKRVSTTMQIDGYSLDAQKSRIKAFADYNDYEIVREYEDAGKSGKSIEGRIQFNQMMDDIKSGKVCGDCGSQMFQTDMEAHRYQHKR